MEVQSRAKAAILANSSPADSIREFTAGWPLLVGAMLGVSIGVAAIPGPAIGIFMRSWQSEFGWTRTQISLGPSILIAGIAVVSPLLGWLSDRVNPAWLCITGLGTLALSLLLFSRLGPNVRIYYLACAAIAIGASGSSTLTYARAVSRCFVRRRGIALGLTTVGTGVMNILMPALLVPYAARVGWRQGFVSLAVVVAVSTPVVGLLMGRSPHVPSNTQVLPDETGTSFLRALGGRTFWTLALCFGLIPIAVGGLQLHLAALLTDAQVDPATTGRIVSLAGVFLVVGRIGTGWLVDRLFAPWIAAAVMAFSALCIAAVTLFGMSAAIFAAVAVGLSNGAEIDLIGYLTGHYFRMGTYGRVYGSLYAVYLGGVGMSVVLYGQIFDRTGSYTVALQASAALLLTSALLFLTLRR
jgi:MFS family permease